MKENGGNRKFKDTLISSLWSGILKICATSLVPLIFWSYFGGLAEKIEDFFRIAQPLRPLFLSTILVSGVGLCLYTFVSMALLKCIFIFDLRMGTTQFDGKFKNSGTSENPIYDAKNIGLRINCDELPSVSWFLVKLFRIKITLKTDPDLVSVRIPDGDTPLEAYMSKRGFLKIDLTKRISGKHAIGKQHTLNVIFAPYSLPGDTCNLYAKVGIFSLGKILMKVNIKKSGLELR